MKVLIVEDNRDLNNTIKNALNKEGFTIFSAFNGEVAKEMAYINKPDIILLDIMLPDLMGYNLIRFFKKHGDPVVIVISALEEEETRRLAYEKGADDYLVKPITLFELQYKLKAINRRKKSSSYIFTIGDITFNLESLELICQNNIVILQRSQIAVLKMLYEKHIEGNILDKNEIIDFDGAGDSTSFRIHTLIGRLRKNLVEVGSEKIIIENIYGKGYELVVIN